MVKLLRGSKSLARYINSPILKGFVSFHFFLFTVKSFVEATRYLLSQPGVRFLLSERFCQDPLEAFFGNQRAKGGRNDHPTIKQFLDNTVSLRVQGSAALNPVRGNCRKRKLERIVDDTPLPKKHRIN